MSQESQQREAVRDAEGKRLVELCLAGDEQARSRFQEQFAPLVYRFADRCAGSRAVEAGDFYLYLFDDDRLFLRLRGYRGAASLEPFLRGYVLPDLLNQFLVMRHRKTLETVSLDSEYDASAVAATDDAEDERAPARRADGDLLDRLPTEKRLLLKLMYIEDFELEAQEIQLLARESGRSVREVIERIEQARESVRARECARREKEDQAESAGQWILRYDRELAEVRERLRNLPPGSTRSERLRQEEGDLERKRSWREDQRRRALDDSRRTTVTLRYREIAEILNVPIGSVSAQITRLRQELVRMASSTSDSDNRQRDFSPK